MSTLADELLQDFEDTDGSDAGDDQQDDGFLNGAKSLRDVGMDGDDSDDDEGKDVDMDTPDGDAVETTDDPEEAKARVEKMQLGGVRDVRNVAGLMKTLEPVLQVSDSCETPVRTTICLHQYPRTLALTISIRRCRK
jgi:U4/U6 small nuclear ribonucleoprotein PRP31